VSTDLTARREQLCQRSAQLRERIAERAQVLKPGLRAVDRVRNGVRAAQDNPVWLLLGVALAGAALARPRAVFDLGLRVWSGWRLWRRIRPLVSDVPRLWR
jgi:hypothetical protein